MTGIKDLPELYVQYVSTNDKELEQYNSEVIDLCLDKAWSDVWEFLVGVAELPGEVPPSVLAVIAAGPLEDLISEVGNDYIERILKLAKMNRRFSLMLTGVWKSSINERVWNRVFSYCRTAPDALDGTYRY